MNKLDLLENGKRELVSYYENKFEEEKGAKLKKENERLLTNFKEENDLIKKENKSIKIKNRIIFTGVVFFIYATILTILLIFKKTHLPALYSPIMIFFFFESCLGGVLFLQVFGINFLDEKTLSLSDIKKEKELYFENYKSSIEEIKRFYGILVEYLGEEELNKKIIELRSEGEDVGSYNLILRIYENSIKNEDAKIKGDDIYNKLKKIIN